MLRRLLAIAALAIPALAAAAPTAAAVVHPAWARSANIYEVNIRQYSPAGDFKGVETQLPRLRAMGVDILWLMPINPISEKNRKGPLGSYYAVRDYKAVNPEFGTLGDLQRLVEKAHALKMKVILDWVANHTGFDNAWITQHPDWYQHDAQGRIGPYTFRDGDHTETWEDVVGLDYSRPALREAMIDAMTYWVRVADIDGFRCDVAGKVPVDFWEAARVRLETIKPVFMLAESDDPRLQVQAFDMTYDWALYHLLVKIAHGQGDARDLARMMTDPPKTYPKGAYRMTFTSDHDENSWQGTDRELYGDSARAFAVLAATWPGMPLVYSGQEAGLDKRLEFFKRDPIDWDHYGRAGFYRTLLALKHTHPALWNGIDGGRATPVDVGSDHVFAFRRDKGSDGVFVALNLSDQIATLSHAPVPTLPPHGVWVGVRTARGWRPVTLP